MPDRRIVPVDASCPRYGRSSTSLQRPQRLAIALLLLAAAFAANGAETLPAWALGPFTRPKDAQTLQAVSAVGQGRLIATYNQVLAELSDLVGGQVLIAPHDFMIRDQYLHARGTLDRLLELGVIPIVNENDAIADDEIYLCSYLLARAFGPRSRNVVELVELALGVVSAAAATNALTDSAWHMLAPHFPESHEWQFWDRRQRLLAGIGQLYVRKNLSASSFGRLGYDASDFECLVEAAAKE